MPIANPNFAAVLLAGGRSTRMGRDKATLIIDGEPLWRRQLATLRALNPTELFISGRCDGPYANAGIEIIEDAIPDLGPLGGIAAALRRADSPLILVLAIDLPAMTASFLATLFQEKGASIPRSADSFEPLAALYPKTALSLADKSLQGEDRSMQRFVRQIIQTGLARTRAIASNEAAFFCNVNCPEDLPNMSPEQS